MSMDMSAKTVEDYIAARPNAKEYLEKARKTILQALPGAKEKISYGIPTFEFNGKNIVHIGAYDTHYAFYPGAIVTQFAEELKDYNTGKGTIQFPIDKPVPYDLIKKITLASVERALNKKK